MEPTVSPTSASPKTAHSHRLAIMHLPETFRTRVCLRTSFRLITSTKGCTFRRSRPKTGVIPCVAASFGAPGGRDFPEFRWNLCLRASTNKKRKSGGRLAMRKAAIGEREVEVLRFVAEHAPVSAREVAEQFGEPEG